MGLKDIAAGLIQAGKAQKAPATVIATFGPNFLGEIEGYQASVRQGHMLRVNFDFPDTLLAEIDDSIGLHAPTGNVLYSDDMQFVDVVGESFHQEALRPVLKADREAHREWDDGEDSDWYAGFLVPEPWNEHDLNAVMVMMIIRNGKEFQVIQVGHLEKTQAKKVQKKIIGFLNQGAVIPLLMKLTGGTKLKPSVGVLARAKTSAIKF